MKLSWFLKHEIVLLLVCGLVIAGVGSINPSFLSWAAFFEVLRGSIPYALMGLGIMPVMLMGEIDISFVAIAACSSLITHNLLKSWGYSGGLGYYLAIALPLGSIMGIFVGTVAVLSGLPLFPVSLGFWLMLYGINLFFISPEMRFDLPQGLVGFYSQYFIKVKDPVVGETGLHLATIYVLLVAVSLFLVLRYTTFGRGLYIAGGNRDVATRSGYNVQKLLALTMGINGGLAAFGGTLQCAFKRFFDPILFRGAELFVIAACVIGGVAIGGGKGTVAGTLLGVLFVQIITRGLIYLGIQAIWHQLVLGAILILFVSLTSARSAIWTVISGRRPAR